MSRFLLSKKTITVPNCRRKRTAGTKSMTKAKAQVLVITEFLCRNVSHDRQCFNTRCHGHVNHSLKANASDK